MASEESGDVLPQQDDAPAWGADGWNGGDDQTSPDDEDGGEYDPEYDPESVPITSMPAPTIERPASDSPRPTKKPKTAGGFIIENSSDEEDDTPVPAPVYQPDTLKPTPSEAQIQPFSNAPPQPNITPQDATNNIPPQENNEPAPPTAMPAAAIANATRLRLPADIVGILEDRIKEDPRGDMDAWLALIDEQKKRHKIEDARAVYERFLKVFPQAVSPSLSFNSHYANYKPG